MRIGRRDGRVGARSPRASARGGASCDALSRSCRNFSPPSRVARRAALRRRRARRLRRRAAVATSSHLRSRLRRPLAASIWRQPPLRAARPARCAAPPARQAVPARLPPSRSSPPAASRRLQRLLQRLFPPRVHVLTFKRTSWVKGGVQTGMRGVKTAGVHTDEVVFKHCSNSSRSEDAAPRPRPRHSHTTAADDQAHRQAASVFHHYNREEGKKDGFFYIRSVRRLLPGDGARAGGVCWVKIGSMQVPVNRLSKVEVDVCAQVHTVLAHH